MKLSDFSLSDLLRDSVEIQIGVPFFFSSGKNIVSKNNNLFSNDEKFSLSERRNIVGENSNLSFSDVQTGSKGSSSFSTWKIAPLANISNSKVNSNIFVDPVLFPSAYPSNQELVSSGVCGMGFGCSGGGGECGMGFGCSGWGGDGVCGMGFGCSGGGGDGVCGLGFQCSGGGGGGECGMGFGCSGWGGNGVCGMGFGCSGGGGECGMGFGCSGW